jgi:hypothetical protein
MKDLKVCLTINIALIFTHLACITSLLKQKCGIEVEGLCNETDYYSCQNTWYFCFNMVNDKVIYSNQLSSLPG